MIIEEARDILQEQIDKYGQEYDAESIEALEMAIQALSSWANYSDELWKKAHIRGYGEGYNRGYEDGKMRVRDKNDE